MVKSIINEMLEMTYPDEYYKNVIEPAKTGKGAVPSMGQMLMKSQPFKAVSLPFQEMINPGKFGSFRSSGTPMARAITGPLSTAVRGLFSAPAAGIMTALTPTVANADEVNMTAEDFAALNQGVTPQNEPMDIEDFLGMSTPQDLGFIGNAPSIKEAVGITDRNRGLSYFDPVTRTEVAAPNAQGRPSMADIAGDINLNMTDLGNPLGDPRIASEEQGLSGFPGLGQVDRGFQDVLDAREARRNEIAMQQNPDFGQFFRDTPVVSQKSKFGLGELLSLAGLITQARPIQAASMIANRNKIGRGIDKARSGLGSLGQKIGNFRQNVTGYRTQREFDQARETRSLEKRQANMINRKNAGKTYSAKNLAEVTKELNRQNTAREKAKTQKSQNPNLRSGANSGGGGRSKIVCTMMNDRYGFGSFRNKIWMKFHESYGPEYQKGYHAIFLPLVKIAKGKGKINTAVRKVLEHMGRHVTADMFKIMKGKKRDTLGRIYRAIFEPACHIIGKIKSALGRG